MKLRYYQTYDENGVNSEVELQYQENDDGEWVTVPTIREREVDVEVGDG